MIAIIDGFSPGGVRGRANERREIAGLLRRVAAGAGGGVLLAEGEPGIGTSALLRTAVDEAAALGFSLAVGAADQLGRAIPLFGLRAALGEPFARFTADDAERDFDGAPGWWTGRMRDHLEAQAAARPVLVCLDDVQWACPATLAALRTLPRALSHRPVAWVLARSGTATSDAGHLFDALETDGAVRLGIAPLPDDEVTALLTDGFGAAPGPGLLALAAGAAGNPGLLAELIGGLLDEDAVRCADGRAAVTSSRLPERVHRVARTRLDGLGQPARHLLMTAAVLGASFRLDDAAEMMGESATALLAALAETSSAQITTGAGTEFRFRQPLLRRALHEMIPAAGRTALHRQYGHLLLSRGEQAVQAAGHLLHAVRRGDQASLADLDTAASRTSHSAPETAARLALRAHELTPQADPGALPRAVAATEALAAAGRLDHAYQLGRDTLAKPLPPAAEVRLRCALAGVLCARGQADEAAAEARMALAHPQLPPDLRGRAVTAHLRALAELHDEIAGIAADTVLAAADQHDRDTVVAALTARAVNRWDQGQVGPALRALRDAAGQAGGISADARPERPLLSLAAALIDLGEFAEAEELLNGADHPADGPIPASATLSILRARLDLAGGRLDQADAAGQRALATAEQLGAHGWAATARRLLALTALRRGDIATATRQLAVAAEWTSDETGGHARTETALIRARIDEGCGEPVATLGLVRPVGAGLLARRGVLLDAHASAPWLVRAALAGGETELAGAVARAADALATQNPGYRSLAAAAAHCRGLVAGDQAGLAEAAATWPDPWSRAAAAEDLGSLHVRRADRDGGVRHLSEANRGYESIGAKADAARVRSRLRELGVRHRHWSQSSGRPESGWDSLTETQHQVSALTAQGLNNRQIAAGMYLSSTTVAFHLRQIFRKLDISSRVELARIVMERSLSPPFPAALRAIYKRSP